MTNFFNLILISIIEGITELLPISSTAHTLFLSKLLNANIFSLHLAFLQFIAFIPVLVYYFIFICDLLFPWNHKKSFILFIKLICTFIPAVVICLIFGKYIDLFLNFEIIPLGLISGGFAILFIELFCKDIKINYINDITVKHALIIGLFQSLSIIPGVSRLGVSIIACRLMKFSKELSIDTSFLIGIPIIPGFFFYELINNKVETELSSAIIICCFVTFFIGIVLIKSVIKFLNGNGLVICACYRIMVGILILIHLYN